ncbi:MAG: outer membrane protein assembly factor BamB family protein [Planctomycetota bacterium]
MKVKLTCVVLALLAAVPASADIADLVESSGVKGGLVVHIGCGDGKDTASLRLNDKYIVQGLEVSDEKVRQARENIRAAGDYGKVSVLKFDGRNLPYVDNLVNLIIAGGECRVPQGEIMRVLAPLGVAYIDGRKIVKAWPDEIDEWNHFLHGPDNNAVARDSVAGAPRSVQWMAKPKWGRSHEEMASMSAAVSAKGRVFFIVDKAPLASIRFTGQWELVARDAFNGTLLWKKDIPKWNDHLRHFRSGPVHLPRRLVAVGEAVYVTLGLDAPVTALDAATGRTLHTYDRTERTEEILVQDDVLYLAVGTSEVNRMGEGLFKRGEPEATDFRFVTAVDAKTGRQLWKESCPEGEFLLPLSLTVKGNNVFYQSTAGVVRLNAVTGEEIWKTPRQTPARRMSFSAPTLVATDEVLFCADRIAPGGQAAADKVQWGVHGWNQKDFPRRGKSLLKAYSVETGKELWNTSCNEDYNSAVDIFVVGQTVWVGNDYKGYDVKTGQLKKELYWKGADVAMAHHRCYRNKATEDFIFTGRSGIEVVSLDKGWLGNNSWIRGTCQYGIMPSNGLLYAPPDACGCFPKVKVPGFFAAAPQRGKDRKMPFPDKPVLEKGPAYGKVRAAESPNADDWPMYRHDVTRSGTVPTTIASSVGKRWSATIGGGLTQPVIAGQKVFVASTDSHTVHALNADDGEGLWSFTAGGRIDSPPAVHNGAVIFGSSDGWLYSLRAADGKLAWRFRAAPQERQVGVFGQLESSWPVHGAALVQNNTLYVTAGRSTYLDCGIVLYRLDPDTGRQLSRTVVCDLDPETGQQTGIEPSARFDMEGSASDILSGDGSSVFMKHLHFDDCGKLTKEEKPHLFGITGFLGEEWFVRSYWLIGTDVSAGWGGWANAATRVPAGRILCFDDNQIYAYGREKVASGATGHKLDTYQLSAKTKVMTSTKPLPRKPKNRRGRQATPKAPQEEQNVAWADKKSPIVRAMVLASDKLIVAGPPDLGRKRPLKMEFENESEALAAFKGEKGNLLRVSASNGQMLSECELNAMPVFDGMAAASGCIYLSLKDGTLQCWK